MQPNSASRIFTSPTSTKQVPEELPAPSVIADGAVGSETYIDQIWLLHNLKRVRRHSQMANSPGLSNRSSHPARQLDLCLPGESPLSLRPRSMGGRTGGLGCTPCTWRCGRSLCDCRVQPHQSPDCRGARPKEEDLPRSLLRLAQSPPDHYRHVRASQLPGNRSQCHPVLLPSDLRADCYPHRYDVAVVRCKCHHRFLGNLRLYLDHRLSQQGSS